MYYWVVLFSPLIALLFFAAWYRFFGWGSPGTRRKVSGFLLLGLLLFLAGMGLLTRYEGSTSGSSLPRLAWKWTKKGEAQPGNIRVNTAAQSPEVRDLADKATADFLGANRDGAWAKAPFSFDWAGQAPVELWRRPVGAGWSSFAVSAGRAVTLEQAGPDEQTTCLQLLTGETIWTHADPGIDFVKVKGASSGAAMGGDGPRSTPAIHQGRVFILGSTGRAKCLDFENGKLVWQRDLITENSGVIPKWGKSSCPLILNDLDTVVFTASETEAGATLVSCDLATGEPRWSYRGNGASYSSPRLLALHGVPQIVSVNQHDITGLDPATGSLLWLYEWRGHTPKVGQPQLLPGNRILTTASYGVGSPLIEVLKEGEKWSVREVWKSKWMKTKFSSAVIIGDAAYGIDEGLLCAIDLQTGNKLWKRDKVGFGQNLLVEGHLLIQAENPGDVILGKPTPQGFTELARLPALTSMTWNAPTLADRFLLVRNDREAICFLLPAP